MLNLLNQLLLQLHVRPFLVQNNKMGTVQKFNNMSQHVATSLSLLFLRVTLALRCKTEHAPAWNHLSLIPVSLKLTGFLQAEFAPRCPFFAGLGLITNIGSTHPSQSMDI